MENLIAEIKERIPDSVAIEHSRDIENGFKLRIEWKTSAGRNIMFKDFKRNGNEPADEFLERCTSIIIQMTKHVPKDFITGSDDQIISRPVGE